MTQEKKLLKLLQVAVENGWDIKQINGCKWLTDWDNMLLWNGYTHEDVKYYSLNDLVTNFEKGEISFIEALCKSVKTNKLIFQNTNLPDGSGMFSTGYKAYVSHYIRGWVLLPTCKRFDWLLETFNHLIK